MNMPDLLIEYGYVSPRQLPDGRWVAVCQYFYTAGLVVDCTALGYAYRYCYGAMADALMAVKTWDGHGDPPGPWIKLKGHPTRGEEAGPGMAQL